MHFFLEGDAEPYRSYTYRDWGCDGPCESDDRYRFATSPDGTRDRLFVESPGRPFYLEHDKEDHDLARIVITFVPGARAGAEGAVEWGGRATLTG